MEATLSTAIILNIHVQVVSVDMEQVRVHVKVTLRQEPDLDVVMDNQRLSIRYLPSHVVAEKVGLPTLVLARITGNIQMERGSREKCVEINLLMSIWQGGGGGTCTCVCVPICYGSSSSTFCCSVVNIL